MERPFALHISWTCYGTWLPGDERGYVSNTLIPGGEFSMKENTPGTEYRKDDPFTRRAARRQQVQPTVMLTPEQASTTGEALLAATSQRSWRLVRTAIMANHLHVLVMNCPDDGPAVRRILKGVSQSALSKKAGQSQCWWPAGGSDRYKHDWEAIENAANYIERQPWCLVQIVDMVLRLGSNSPPG
jgi:REP element-mobilizing transposase RayT